MGNPLSVDQPQQYEYSHLDKPDYQFKRYTRLKSVQPVIKQRTPICLSRAKDVTTIKKHKSKQVCLLSLTDPSLNIKKVRSLNIATLHIKVLVNSHTSINKLLLRLRSLPRLSTLILNLKISMMNIDKAVDSLSNGLRNLRFLSKLTFELLGSNMTYQSIQYLCQTLKRLNPLISLTVRFDYYESYIRGGMENIPLSLRRIRNLSSFTFSLNFSIAYDILLKVFCLYLKTLQSLRILTLDLNCMSGYLDETLIALEIGMMNLTTLDTFTLRFNTNTIVSSQRTDELLACLKHIPNFNLRLEEASDTYLKEVLPNLNAYSNLNRLTLKLDRRLLVRNIENENEFVGLSRISSIKKLTHLALTFPSLFQISEGELENLFSCLNGLKQLKTFFIELKECNRPDDQALENLSRRLKNLTGLKSFYLNFSGSPTINVHRLKILFAALKRLKGLTTLILCFRSYVHVNKEDVEALILSHEFLGRLRYINIEFYGVTWRNLMGVETLSYQWRRYNPSIL